MCRDCGQFNRKITTPVWIVDTGQAVHVIPEETYTRMNGVRTSGKYLLGSAFSEHKTVRVMNAAGEFVHIDGNTIQSLHADYIELTYYRDELLHETMGSERS